MLNLNLIIIKVNEFVGLTEASIRKNMPDVSYTVVDMQPCGILGTALNASDGKISFVVASGVVLNIQAGDLPPLASINKYHLCAARNKVYCDHEKYTRFYSYVNDAANKRELDLNVFIINPTLWGVAPEQDKGSLRDKRILVMPRYMNHKQDALVETCLSPYEALKYGMLGEHAAVLNYNKCLESGAASLIERYAYCFDKLAPYLDLLGEEQKQICSKLIRQSTIARMRTKLSLAMGFRR